ncbi:protein kinase [Gracilaria domingensis]|nr:protein kinase [Gracilaria domingensis]
MVSNDRATESFAEHNANSEYMVRYEVPETLREHIEIGHLFQQRWIMLGFIGEGGFGYVFKAYDTFLKKNVAIKLEFACMEQTSLLDEYFVQSRIINNSKSINIQDLFPKMYTFSSSENLSFIVMDLLGISLACLCDNVGLLKRSEVIQVGIRLLHTLEYIHSLGVVHCDIKPENILMPADSLDFSKARLIDFGVSQYLRDIHGNVLTGQVPGGTVDYLSRGGHDRKSAQPGDDLESLAYVLLELFTGNLPWSKDYEEHDDRQFEEITFAKKCELYKTLPASSVCSEMPQLAPFLDFIHQMDRENPDYTQLRHLLARLDKLEM